MRIELKVHLENLLGRINRITSLSGGDISSAYRIRTAAQDYFVKANNSPDALKMFEAEKLGLETIAKTMTVKTPQVFHQGQFNGPAFLVMDFIETKTPGGKDFELLGMQLAQMHRISQKFYGAQTNNFIGSLRQSNQIASDWPSFFASQRLFPQIELAQKNGLLTSKVPAADVVENTCNKYLLAEYPSLIHGDLWAGNFLISHDGKPVLIDPAVYHGHCQVDIAMSRLFGGFGEMFYQAYNDQMPGAAISAPQLDIYQLYYLLVHLNLFGSSYYAPVRRILDRYF